MGARGGETPDLPAPRFPIFPLGSRRQAQNTELVPELTEAQIGNLGAWWWGTLTIFFQPSTLRQTDRRQHPVSSPPGLGQSQRAGTCHVPVASDLTQVQQLRTTKQNKGALRGRSHQVSLPFPVPVAVPAPIGAPFPAWEAQPSLARARARLHPEQARASNRGPGPAGPGCPRRHGPDSGREQPPAFGRPPPPSSSRANTGQAWPARPGSAQPGGEASPLSKGQTRARGPARACRLSSGPRAG